MPGALTTIALVVNSSSVSWRPGGIPFALAAIAGGITPPMTCKPQLGKFNSSVFCLWTTLSDVDI